MDFAIEMWNKNKWLFFLLIPVILLFIFKDVIISLVAGNIHNTVKDAEKQDETLKADAEKLNDQANKERDEAQQIQNQVNGRDTSDVNEDWYKKK
jgi:uncharacterized protein YlxW (UPF0749 family)